MLPVAPSYGPAYSCRLLLFSILPPRFPIIHFLTLRPLFFRAPAFQDLPIWPSGGGPSSVSDSLLGALPHQARTPVPKAAMIYKLASSRPAQAVDTSDNSRRVDGDGGGAAGTSLAGVGAVSAIGNQSR